MNTRTESRWLSLAWLVVLTLATADQCYFGRRSPLLNSCWTTRDAIDTHFTEIQMVKSFTAIDKQLACVNLCRWKYREILSCVPCAIDACDAVHGQCEEGFVNTTNAGFAQPVWWLSSRRSTWKRQPSRKSRRYRAVPILPYAPIILHSLTKQRLHKLPEMISTSESQNIIRFHQPTEWCDYDATLITQHRQTKERLKISMRPKYKLNPPTLLFGFNEELIIFICVSCKSNPRVFVFEGINPSIKKA